MLNESERTEYLKRLGMPEAPAPTKSSLDALIYAHQTHIPFETIGVHRGSGAPDLSIDTIYGKVVTEGKGAYCFELNKLFQELLESLGFTVRPVLCRAVRGRDIRMPINHRGLIVTIDDEPFFVDVGFGGPMPAGALALTDGIEQDICNETYIADKYDHAWWKIDRITKAGNDAYDDEVPVRRQTEMEVCTAVVEEIDFDPLNAFFSMPGTLFRDHEIANLRTDNGYKGYRDGVLTLRENGKKIVMEFSDDSERAAALAEHFGLAY